MYCIRAKEVVHGLPLTTGMGSSLTDLECCMIKISFL